ncbi:DM13 domain-containing protein [Chlorogloeopsis sp. ULAP01]|uniref:DM13 domain-containing protein n=1 Tax=Chlorogloeopsis sp. ULAP01 TaxID=3056483 RepID=UPI0025AA7B2B|nr:DM13 domain-containing protein [Chlorogloeopsis sp. ULAP01]MDM9382039.1 DM13 domain-containing protein [Chlorogloeopsis sp. ULAP01]
MKFKHFAIFSIATLLIVGCTKQVSSNQTNPETTPAVVTAQSTTSAAKTGVFKSAEQPTQGMIKFVTEKGQRYLEFDQNFKTNRGPDLFVILYRNSTVPVSGIKEKDYMRIARLQKISGTQRYAIPSNVKLEEFKSVAVWCRAFNATFGYAPYTL